MHASSSVTATSLQLIPDSILFKLVSHHSPCEQERRGGSQVRVPKADPDRFRPVEVGTCQIPRKFERN